MKAAIHLAVAAAFFCFFGLDLARAQAAPIENLETKKIQTLSQIVVNRIEVLGATVVRPEEIQNAYEIFPGDRLERVKVVRTAENIQEVYRTKGYEQTQLSTRLIQKKGGGPSGGQSDLNILEYKITEGLPTRIESIELKLKNEISENVKKYWEPIRLLAVSRISLRAGDELDLNKVSESKRVIQDLLANEEFIGAKLDEVQAEVMDKPPTALWRKIEPAHQWVKIVIPIDLGDRVSFGFRGNSIFSIAELKALIEEQRLIGFGKDYISEIQSRILAKYISSGYSKVKVSHISLERSQFQKDVNIQDHRIFLKTLQDRRITFVIDEGERTLLHQVDFDGVTAFSPEQLRRIFFEKGSLLLQQRIVVEKDLQLAAELLVDWMKSQGYLSAKLVNLLSEPVELRKRQGKKQSAIRTTLYLSEGDQTRVKSISIRGVSVLSQEEIAAALGVVEGAPLNLFALTDGIQVVKSAIRSLGYLGVQITNEGSASVVQYSEANRWADIQLDFVEGPQFTASEIYIEGLSFTEKEVVRRELEFHEGDVLRESAVLETESKLRKLGLFARVSINILEDPQRPQSKIVQILLKEGTPGLVAGGPGFREDIGLRLFGQIAYNNLWGLNHTLSFTTSINRRVQDFRFAEYQAQLAYNFPWFLGHDLIFRPTLTASGAQYVRFDATTVNAALTWEKRLIKRWNLTGILTYSLERTNQFNAQEPDTVGVQSDNRELRIGALVPGLRWDTRDNPLLPSRGWYGTLTYEWAASYFFSQEELGYSRVQGRLDRHIPLPLGITAYLSYRGGFARSAVLGSPIPLIKHFALGGSGSLRGYSVQEVEEYDQSILGSLSYSNYRTQVDFPVSGALKIGPFLDAANLLIDNSSLGRFFFHSLLYGAGIGIHYQTPVGPINFDWGIKLNPQPGDTGSRHQLYFSIGVI